MAWVTPALLVEGLRIYARAVYSVPPPGSSSSGSSSSGSSSGSTPPADVSQRTRAVEAPRESLPPGVAGLVAWARTWGLPRPAVIFGALLLVALLGLEGCAGNGSSGGADVLAGIWKAVTVGCQGVRLAEPLVDGLRRSSSSSGSDASSSSSGSDASSSSGSMDRMDAGL